MLPLISLILLVHSWERYLAEAIDSALAQTYRNFRSRIRNDQTVERSPSLPCDYAQSRQSRFIAVPPQDKTLSINLQREQESSKPIERFLRTGKEKAAYSPSPIPSPCYCSPSCLQSPQPPLWRKLDPLHLLMMGPEALCGSEATSLTSPVGDDRGTVRIYFTALSGLG